MKIKLTGAKGYFYNGTRYVHGVVYDVSEEVGDDLLDKMDEADNAYFQLAREKDGPAVKPKVEAEPAKGKKATKKTIKVGGGKVGGADGIEGMNDGDDGDDGKGEGPAVEV